VWTWDITYLATTVRGSFFYLYLILALFSRKIVGWEVHEHESADQAAVLFGQFHRHEDVDRHALTLHSDNGAPMNLKTAVSTPRQPLAS
jgi:transposase InsO family protein